MDRLKLVELLQAVKSGQTSTSDAAEILRHLPYKDLQFAKIDSHRSLRQGLAEVIFCPGKTAEQIVKIAQSLKEDHAVVLASRLDSDKAESVLSFLPEAQYNQLARTLIWGELPEPRTDLPKVSIVTAGTADLPVAEEAVIVLRAAAVPLDVIYDVGVAGIQRLFANLDKLQESAVTIVVAGMDGALPSVLAGLLPHPIIAVPTSIGYGANFQGIAPLLSMLNSCAGGLTVVNIDNGFGAAMSAWRILFQFHDRHAPLTKRAVPAPPV